MEQTQNNTFENLVKNMDQKERKHLLSKITSKKQNSSENQNGILQNEERSYTLKEKLKTESFWYRLLLRFQSWTKHVPIKELYNEACLNKLANYLTVHYPKYVDAKKQYLLTDFYKLLKDLRSAAVFFGQSLEKIYQDTGNFYVFLSKFIAPEIQEALNASCDPYKKSFDDELDSNYNHVINNNVDKAVSSLPSDLQAKMYNAVKEVEFLYQFVTLPYNDFITLFVDPKKNGEYTCMFKPSQAIFARFLKVLGNYNSFSKNILKIIFLYNETSEKKITEEIQKKLQDKIKLASPHIYTIELFTKSIPLYDIARVMFHDWDFNITPSRGKENWQQDFKEGWKKYYEKKLASFTEDRNKHQLNESLRSNFNVDHTPLLPFRPWDSVWTPNIFKKEQTAGFIYYLAENKQKEFMTVINLIILNGNFQNPQNRSELADAGSLLDVTLKETLDYANSLNPDEEHGHKITVLREAGSAIGENKLKMEQIMRNQTDMFVNYSKNICSASESIENVFRGILDPVDDPKYKPLSNLNTIKGQETESFLVKMKEVRKTLENSRQILLKLNELKV